MKKLLRFVPLMVLCLVLLLFLPQKANAASESDLTFKLNSDGASYCVTDCSTSAAGDLVIPSTYEGLPVTEIGNRAFADCSKLTSVVIPDSITYVGYSAFERCYGLTSVTISNHITEISDWMFDHCDNLTSITIPDGVTEIGYGAFNSCVSLRSITIPASLDYMGPGAFNSCIGLTDVYIADVSAWCRIDFNHELNDYTMPQYNTPMYYARKLHILDAEGNEQTEIVLDPTVTTVPVLAFKGSGITSITIPDSVTAIGAGAFTSCTALQDVHYGGTEEQWEAITVDDYNAPLLNATLHCKSSNYPFTYEIVNGAVTITGYDASLSGELVIPDTIEGYPVTAIGDRAFEYCSGLTSVVLPEGIIRIGHNAFFVCTELTSVNIPGSVTEIGRFAFSNCYKLTSVSIPESVTSIGQIAFGYCKNMDGIWVDENNMVYSSDESGVLFNKEKTQLIRAPGGLVGRYIIPDSVISVTPSAFEGCEKLINVIISNSVINVGYSAFTGCASLTSITLSENMTSIDSSVFSCCYKLASITIPKSITSIGYNAFSYCSVLDSITIPAGVTSIGGYAFKGCTALQDVLYDGTKEQWDAITIADNNEQLSNVSLHCKDMEIKKDGRIVLLLDAATKELTVATESTLDLNGHILTVDSLASFGQIIDSVGGGGLIVENIEITSNEWLPIQDESGCYRFYEHEEESLGTKSEENSTVFGFTLDFTDSAAYDVLAGNEDVQITVTLAVGENSQTYAFSKELVAQYVALVKAYPTLRPYLKLTVTGMDTLTEGTVVTVTPAITTVGGKIQMIGESMQYIA